MYVESAVVDTLYPDVLAVGATLYLVSADVEELFLIFLIVMFILFYHIFTIYNFVIKVLIITIKRYKFITYIFCSIFILFNLFIDTFTLWYSAFIVPSTSKLVIIFA